MHPQISQITRISFEAICEICGAMDCPPNPVGQQPNIPDETLLQALRAHYNLNVSALTYLPLGADMDSAVYAVQAGREKYFLKLRARAGFSAKSLLVPAYLHGRGVGHLQPPIETRTGESWVSVGDYVLAVSSFIDGRTATKAKLSGDDWADLGRTMAMIHAMTLPPELERLVPRERYVPSRREILADVQARIEAPEDQIVHELAQLWKAHEHEINLLLERAAVLGARLQAAGQPLVLCHADLHTWNMLVDDRADFWMVDWDEAVLAPKERDLMFVVEGIGAGLVKPNETARFLEGYGDPFVEPLAIAYYRYAWAVQDLMAYAEQAVLRRDASEDARREALDGLKMVLRPGQIASIALASDME